LLHLSADPDARYSLEELLACAGEQLGEEINPRTVRLYATQGLIDRPDKDGRRAVYGQRQLLQLLLIRSLAQRGLSLAAIAPLVAGSDAELSQQLLQLEDAPVMASPAAEASNEALDYLRELGGAAPLAVPERPEGTESLLRMLMPPSSRSGSGTPLPSRRGTSSGSSAEDSTARPSSNRISRANRWQRFSLAPGIELHLSEAAPIPPPGRRREVWLQRLLDRLQQQLGEHP
jgi:DNA-binding transcriptional MerR regulator